ncbi:TPA: glycine-rich domain-containing protein [Klebsiella pneumoniae]
MVNQFKPFAIGSNANVTSQSDWENLDALAKGFQSGKASSAQVNKALRQGTFIAAALAQFVSQNTGDDVLDDGDLDGFVEKLSIGYEGRLVNVQRILSSGTYIRTPGATKGLVEVVGAGGGGGGARATAATRLAGGAGGGGGGYSAHWFDSLPETQTVVIGSGGAGGINTGPASAGGNSSFGAITATGGEAGSGSLTDDVGSGDVIQQAGGGGGLGSGGNLVNSYGGTGTICLLTTSRNSTSGCGGGTKFSGGPKGPAGRSGDGISGAYGAGGSGALSDASPTISYNGGAGGSGIIYVWEYA